MGTSPLPLSSALLPPSGSTRATLTPDGREEEGAEEGSWSPGSPRAAPDRSCKAWTMPAASGHRPGGAPDALPAARRAPRPGPGLTALHLAAFLGGRRVPHAWGEGNKGPRRGLGAGAAPPLHGRRRLPLVHGSERRALPALMPRAPAGRRGRLRARGPAHCSAPATAAGAGAGAAARQPRADTPPSPPRPPCAPPGSRAPRRSRPRSFPRPGARPGCDAPARDADARARGVGPAEVRPGGRDWLARSPARPDAVVRAGVPRSRAPPAPWSGAWGAAHGLGLLCVPPRCRLSL